MSEFEIELSSPLIAEYSGALGGPNQGGHQPPDWYIQYGMDLSAPDGTDVLASFDGHITRLNPHNPADDNGKVYGAQIFIRSHNDLMGGFYTHLANVPADLVPGSSVTRGQVLGTVMTSGGIPPHVHMALVEIIGGPGQGRYQGVDLYDLFQKLSGTDAVSVVQFFQSVEVPPSAADGVPVDPDPVW